MRNAFNHYMSFWEVKKLLNQKQYVEFDKALCQVQFLEKHIDDIDFKDPILKMAWTSIKHSLSSTIKGYVAKTGQSYKSLICMDGDTPCQGGTKGGEQGACQEGEEKGEVQEKGKGEKKPPTFEEFFDYALSRDSNVDKIITKNKYESWIENGWRDGYNNKIVNWKSKLINTVPYLKAKKGKVTYSDDDYKPGVK